VSSCGVKACGLCFSNILLSQRPFVFQVCDPVTTLSEVCLCDLSLWINLTKWRFGSLAGTFETAGKVARSHFRVGAVCLLSTCCDLFFPF